jgi:RES domain-containing protein
MSPTTPPTTPPTTRLNTLHAWRIVKSKLAATAFSGDGTRKFGGCWNSPGTPLVYLAGSTSLAILEMLVHLNAPELLHRYVLFEIIFNPSLVIAIHPASLPRNWQKSPAPSSLQNIGDAWIAANASPLLQIPSAIVPNEFNYLLNPHHPDFKKITISPKRPLRFDPRLLK